MSYRIVIKADTNDADYVMSDREISEERINQLRPLLEMIRNFKPYVGTREDWKYPHVHNWPTGDCRRDDLGELSPDEIYKEAGEEAIRLFESYIPYGEYGIHTIKSVEVFLDVPRERLV